MQWHRVSALIRASAPIRVHPYQAAEIYALLTSVLGAGRVRGHSLPDGLMVDAPERARIEVRRGESFALGFALLGHTNEEARTLVERLRKNLRSLGNASRAPGVVLQGNFELVELRDRVAGEVLGATGSPRALSRELVQGEVERAHERTTLTLRFTTPLRAKRFSGERAGGHGYFDSEYFEARLFARRLVRRLLDVGAPLGFQFDDLHPVDSLTLLENRLVWLDLAYGPLKQRKSLGGAVGEVRVQVEDPRLAEALVWGQYARVGENTRFGFGEYRIAELGPHPCPSPRSRSLLEWSLASSEDEDPLSATAEVSGLASGALHHARARALDGSYEPEPHTQLMLAPGTPKERWLSIPRPVDRALQRAVLHRLAPALDCMFETSAFAYRRGLNRDRAARAVGAAIDAGYRYGLRADFRRFFDSVDQSLLMTRFAAYVDDERLCRLVEQWVRAGTADAGRGLPTGAPISPLLSNLFLDRFDEEIEREGARLVRYADDFVILVRDPAQADHMFGRASELAEQLCLALNEKKLATVEVGREFTFLGFRFFWRRSWHCSPLEAPKPIDKIGWHEGRAPEDEFGREAPLPGELPGAIPRLGASVVAGFDVKHVSVREGALVFARGKGGPESSVTLEQVQDLTLAGAPTLTARVVDQLVRRRVPVLLSDAWGIEFSMLSPAADTGDADAVLGQVDLVRDAERSLHVGKQLIAAKLHNHAAAAGAIDASGEGEELAAELRGLAESCAGAHDASQLLGFEGAGAANWYAWFAERLPTHFDFPRRVAPHATDPINALLNLAQTILHRWVTWSVVQGGLSPALGVLHKPRSGHAALASDLQEPFRHLMDRAVLALAPELRRDDFIDPAEAPGALRARPHVRQKLVAAIQTQLSKSVLAQGEGEARSYADQIVAQTRSLRRHMVDPTAPFVSFRHTCPST